MFHLQKKIRNFNVCELFEPFATACFCAPSVIGSALQSIDKILQFIGTLVLHLIKALNQFGSYTPLLRGDHYGSS